MRFALAICACTLSMLFCATWAEATITAGATVEQWRVAEIVLHSAKTSDNPFFSVDVDAEFTGPHGVKLRRPAFWDGGNAWKVRFAPTQVGDWTYTTTSNVSDDSGLNEHHGIIRCVPYRGNLPIYRHGFPRVGDNKRTLAYRDGTPFFWLADTHWLWEKERLDASNKPGWPAQFQGMVDRRIQQGFTVYQVELFGRWKDAPLGGSVGNGQSTLNLVHFQTDIDPKWKYLADKGVVVATTLGILPKNVTPEQAKNEARMARYVCARYGAYPAVWIMYQECTANLKEQYANENQRLAYANAVRGVGEAYRMADCYHHPRSAHSDASLVTAYRGEDWLDFTLFQGGHSKSINYERYYDFYYDPKTTLPQVEGEANYERLFDGSVENQYQMVTTDSMREKAYRAVQCGCCGYTYGANGVWQATWGGENTPNQSVYGTNPWYDGIDFPGGDQLKHLKAFYAAIPWASLVPRPDCDGFMTYDRRPLNLRPVASVDAGVNTFVVYYPAGPPNSCLLKRLRQTVYTAKWYNPRTGTYTNIARNARPMHGEWLCPKQPDDNDWLLLLTANKPIRTTSPKTTSRWYVIKSEREQALANNVARQATVTASSTDLVNKVYSPENAIDGNIDTNDWRHWSNDASSDPASATKPVWFMLTWKKPVGAGKIIFYTMTGYEAQDYRFEYDNGAGWKTVPGTNTTGNTESVREYRLPAPLLMRRLRFMGLRGSVAQPELVRVVEINACTK